MFDSEVSGLGSSGINFPVIGLLILLTGLIYLILIRVRDGNPRKKSKGGLEGVLIYDYGRKILERSIELDGSYKMEFSIGPEVLSDNHMKAYDGTSFKFTVRPVKSQDDIQIINIKCHPPGVLKHKGKFMSDINLYNGWEITMNDIPIRYESDEMLVHGRNKLRGRMYNG